MLVPYRNSNNPSDGLIHFFDGVPVPEGFVALQVIYLVKPCKDEEKDYTIFNNGQTIHYRFASEAGRQHFFGKGVTRKTSYVAAATNYECLVAAGVKDFYKLTKATPAEEVQELGVIGEENG